MTELASVPTLTTTGSCALCQPYANAEATFCSPTCERVSGEVLRLLRQRRAHLDVRELDRFHDGLEAAVELADLEGRIGALSAARRRALALHASRWAPS